MQKTLSVKTSSDEHLNIKATINSPRQPSFRTRSSPSNSFGSSGSLPDLLSFTFAETSLISPSQKQKRRSNLSLIDILNADKMAVKIRFIPYHGLNFQIGPDEDETELTKLPADFFDRMYCMYAEHGILTAYRLQKNAYQASNRRYSFCYDGQILASPKETNTSTKTNPFDTLCTGHLPEDTTFLSGDYNLPDNNNTGNFPAAICELPSDPDLLTELQAKVDGNIIEAKKFGHLICYAKFTEKYTKKINEQGEKVCLPTGELNKKHYIQEAETIASIMDRLSRGVYTFVSANTEEITFKAQNGCLCKIYFSMLMPSTLNSFEFKEFTNLLQLAAFVEQNQNIENCHAPVYYQKNDAFIPVQTLAGANGFHITGDADPEHIGLRRDMPKIANKTFSGSIDKAEKFLFGLRLLIARLHSKTKEEFAEHVYMHLKNIADDQETIKAYTDIIEANSSVHFINYLEIAYYNNIFLPICYRASILYENNPELLKKVGTSSLYNLIMQLEFDHPLSMHGTEDMNLDPHAGTFGAILICYKGYFVITADERSYLAFLLHDREILAQQHMGIHPYWLCPERENGNLAEQWLDFLRIQALHEAIKDKYEIKMYHQDLIKNISLGRSSEAIAIYKINNMFESLYEFLESCDYKENRINFMLDTIYDKYATSTAAVLAITLPKRNQLRRNSM